MLERLDALGPGEAGEVVRIDCPEALRRRMEELALVPGTKVCCRCRSPRGAVLALQLRRTVLALRRADAAQIIVRRC